MSSHAELATIRKLSQYRPFERGGRDAFEAQEDLLLAAFAEADTPLEGTPACQAAVETLFNIRFDEMEISRAVESLLAAGKLERRDASYVLSDAEQRRLASVASESIAVAERAIDEWLESIAARFPGLSENDADCLRADLDTYLRVVIQRHGAEAALVLYPDSSEAQRLYDDLEELGFDFLEEHSPRIHQIRQFALSQFIRDPTDTQRRFLSQNLSTGYFWTVLSIDPEGARIVQKLAAGQRVYLDTNVIFRLLGIQGPKHVRPAEILIERTQAAGYETCVTPWTIDELKRRLQASRDFLKQYSVPPREYAALAADAASDDDFVTLYWRRVREEPGLKVDDFLGYYDEVQAHLLAKKVPTRNEGCVAVANRHQDIANDVAILERVIHGGRLRALKTLQHDAMHRLLIEKRRGDANRTFATASAWFLTYDSVLPRYDNLARGKGANGLPFCVSAASWFQVVEAFNPKSGDLDQVLADLLASPYVRYRRTLSIKSAQAIVARVNLHAEGTPELAARIFMNTAGLEQVESAGNADEQIEKIDNALIVAAREVQDEAHMAKEQAQEARARADQAEKKAKEQVWEAERREREAIEQERTLRESAVRDQEARGKEELRQEAARAAAREQTLEAQRRTERDRASQEIARQAAIARRTSRRLHLGAACTILTVLFLLVCLAVGLKTAWAYVVALGVVLGIGATLYDLISGSDDTLESPSADLPYSPENGPIFSQDLLDDSQASPPLKSGSR